MTVVAVLGASGFVGSAAVKALALRNARVLEVTSPRLPPTPEDGDLSVVVERHAATSEALAQQFERVDVVVCCAGNPDASSNDTAALLAVNAVLPGVVGAACRLADVRRFIHVSSAAVQGRLKMLDSSNNFDTFSPYARSKAAGERLARAYGPPETTIYRPPSVHHASRRVTRRIRVVARSPLRLVAAPGNDPSPQALIGNVAAALAFLALSQDAPPTVVHHPSEGLTTRTVMEYLGRKRPRLVPRPLARMLVSALTEAGRHSTRIAPDARRVEMLMFGQGQAPSWLTEHGWSPPYGPDAWRALGELLSERGGERMAEKAHQG